MKNTKEVTLQLTENGLKKFKTIHTFKNLLHTCQIDRLIVGENKLKVNHYIYSRLNQVVGYDLENMKLINI